MGAIDSRSGPLEDAIAQAPRVLRRSNSTFVELRATLDDLQPLVREARPVARVLPSFSRQLRALAVGARPTLRDLDRLVRRRGPGNDLLDVLRLTPALRDAATRSVHVNGAERPPTLPTLTTTLRELTPQVAFLRPYSVDATGWFDDFGHTGVYDALGGAGRIAFHGLGFANVGGTLTFVPPDLRQQVFDQVAARNQRDRCPGSMERGTVWKPTPGFDCDPRQVPIGR
jgi:phospholipid/cholesterol/gamma-HCH transport system substrate-binding protein